MPIGHGKFMKISSGRDELLAILNNKASWSLEFRVARGVP